MRVLSKSFRERNQTRVGIVGLTVIVLFGGALYNAGAVYQALTSKEFTAQFTDAGNLKPGAPVRLAGVDVGKVSDVRIDGDHVAVDFAVRDVGALGDATRAAIKSSTVLGTKYLAVIAAGRGHLDDGATIPLERTRTAYDVTEALNALTTKSERLDKRQMAQSMNALSEAFAQTPAEVQSALSGLRRVSSTIASRDAALRQLLSNSEDVSKLLADRSTKLVTLLGDSNLVLTELENRRKVLRALLVNVTATVQELNGLVADNRSELGPALDELRTTLDMLNRQEKNVAALIHGFNIYSGSLGEAVSSGPWFYALVPNLVPSNLAPAVPSLIGDGR